MSDLESQGLDQGQNSEDQEIGCYLTLHVHGNTNLTLRLHTLQALVNGTSKSCGRTHKQAI